MIELNNRLPFWLSGSEARALAVAAGAFWGRVEARPESLTDVQRAVRFFTLQKLAFGGRTASPTFGVGTAHPPRINLLRLEETLSAAHLRLAGVGLECLDWRECLGRFDDPDTLFYLDPPYWGSEGDCGAGLMEAPRASHPQQGALPGDAGALWPLRACPG